MARPTTGGGGGFLGSLASSNPFMATGLAGVGIIQGLLQANSQNRALRQQQELFKDVHQKIADISSTRGLSRIRGSLLAEQSGELDAISAGAQRTGEAGAASAVARFRRAGLSGIGEGVGASAKLQSFLKSRDASARLKFEIMGQAQQQQQLQIQSLQGLLSTPFGEVSPVSAAIAGAGSGIEAFVNASHAEQLAGRNNQTTTGGRRVEF